jgi:hypothetical protein
LLTVCSIPVDMQFADWPDVVAKGKIADAVVIGVLVSVKFGDD